jgi:hypothetical protein
MWPASTRVFAPQEESPWVRGCVFVTSPVTQDLGSVEMGSHVKAGLSELDSHINSKWNLVGNNNEVRISPKLGASGAVWVTLGQGQFLDAIIGGGGGVYIYSYIFKFTYRKNNRFQKKSVGQNTNIIYTPPPNYPAGNGPAVGSGLSHINSP